MSGPGPSCSACMASGAEMHEHHLIPRALGGEKGPVADLCSNCHALVHKAADRPESLSRIEDAGHRFRVSQMAAIIVRAQDAVKGDPNRSVTIRDRMPAEVARKLADLASLYGTSQRAALRAAVRSEHARWFGHRRALRAGGDGRQERPSG